MPIPNSAVTIGSPMAMADPNAMSRMTMAAATPMNSVDPGLGASTNSMGWPPSSTSKPGARAASAVSITRWMSAFGRSTVCWSNWTTAYAMCPSGEIWLWPPGSKGLRTAATWGRRPS